MDIVIFSTIVLVLIVLIFILKESESRLKTEFENLANKIFEDRGKVMTDQNSERITGLLQPFKEQLESFRQRVDEVHNKDTEHLSKLLEQIRQLPILPRQMWSLRAQRH